MRRLLLAGLLVLVMAPAAGAAGECNHCDDPTASGGEGTITIVHGVSDTVTGRGPGRPTSSLPQDYTYVNEYAAPTCGGNGLHEDGILCAAAVTSCPALDQVRFWVWHQTVAVQVGPPEVVTEGPWQQEPGSFCLGPDDPGVPSIVFVLAAAQDAFEQRVRDLQPPTISTVPGPRTLVHYPTELSALRADAFDFDVTVAGARVALHVRPSTYDWTFGDGGRARTTVPASSHTYAVNAARSIRVDVTWSGWFTVIGGSEHYPIDPPAHSTGVPGVLEVVEARAENRG
ncbi:MAG: hypothetical protein JWN96_3078 [Mycobacterium sp.]|nr:hypothetical protein [Mycobacterium sp.]